MVSVKVASVAGALAFFATVAPAADMPLPPIYPPPIEEYVVSGWYLRGDIGMTNQKFKGLHQRLYDDPGTTVEAVGMGWTARRSSVSASATSLTIGSAPISPANTAARPISTAPTA